MSSHDHVFLFDINFGFGSESVFTLINTPQDDAQPRPSEGFFLLLNGGNFLLLNGKDLELLSGSVSVSYFLSLNNLNFLLLSGQNFLLLS